MQQPPRLLGDGREDRLGLGAGGDQRRDPPECRLLGGERGQRLVRAGVDDHADHVLGEREQRAGHRHPAAAAEPHPARRAAAGEHLADGGASVSSSSGRPLWTPVIVVNAVFA